MKLSSQTLMRVVIGSLVLAAATVLLQVWISAFDGVVFGKLLTTYAIVAILAALLRAIQSDMDDEGEKKKDDFFN